ncbi:MAG: hypothetical protein JSR23_07575 [Proteobacteria bacterium]|nr:hypothetical protein [Pseudomonadota bacterium]
MNPTSNINEISAALNALAADMAVSISWHTLYQWAGSSPLTVEHYAQLLCHWKQLWRGAREGTPVPAVFLYHGAAKLTLVRENTLDDPPAVALHDLAMIATVLEG